MTPLEITREAEAKQTHCNTNIQHS